MLVQEILREWGEQWDAPTARMYADFKNVKPSLTPEEIVRITAMLDRYETAVEHDNNDLAVDLYDHIRHFLDARKVANAATTDNNEQEESRISAYQKQTEGDDPYWIEDGNADQSLNSAGDEA